MLLSLRSASIYRSDGCLSTGANGWPQVLGSSKSAKAASISLLSFLMTTNLRDGVDHTPGDDEIFLCFDTQQRIEQLLSSQVSACAVVAQHVA